MVERVCLVGEQASAYGEVLAERVSRAAAFLSAGADPRSPSMRFKANAAQPNEDALALCDSGAILELAVADAHYGDEASAATVSAVAAAFGGEALTFEDWQERMVSALAAAPAALSASETALLIARLDRRSGALWGLSYGDCSLWELDASGARGPRNPRSHSYIQAGWSALDLRLCAQPFSIQATPGALLLAFTDGIDECCYRQPELSIQGRDLAELGRAAGLEPEATGRAIVELALAGVRGEPGGQDNIALIAAQGAS